MFQIFNNRKTKKNGSFKNNKRTNYVLVFAVPIIKSLGIMKYQIENKNTSGTSMLLVETMKSNKTLCDKKVISISGN